MDRRRCGNNPRVTADRDMYDIYIRDMGSFGKPEDRIHRAEKIDLEILGQYDGQPNVNNEKVLSLDVDKVLYYIGLGEKQKVLLHVEYTFRCEPGSRRCRDSRRIRHFAGSSTDELAIEKSPRNKGKHARSGNTVHDGGGVLD